MTDRLTQLQDAVDQLANQFVASLFYVHKHHDYSTLGLNDTVRQEAKNAGDPVGNEADGSLPSLFQFSAIRLNPFSVNPYPADVFKAAQKELAQDLILKEQQIELLISLLPGLENSEKDQERMIRQLEKEIKEQDEIHKVALKENKETLERLEAVIRDVKRP
ncbi:related to component of RNA polymerase II holoenzyme [Rhynchosporium secalis]|uniref:Mediator of RNA polymerase II transcription subunit 21 n=1 Tax=Rhynchosporium secalis TaxID=38038 RepID=A0A1E1M3F5_RHYSE|nr:related to component of RNA polymerase II holoenzyme [Rhynchosporium secalis]